MTDDMLAQVDTLLRAAQACDDQSEKDTALREAVRLVREYRQRVEVANMPDDVRALFKRYDDVVQ